MRFYPQVLSFSGLLILILNINSAIALDINPASTVVCNNTNEIAYSIPLGQAGFYIIEETLPSEQPVGINSLLVDSQSRAPKRSKEVGILYEGTMHGGVTLRERGLSPSWVAFSTFESGNITVRVTDYLNNMPSFKLELAERVGNAWIPVFDTTGSSGRYYTVENLEPGFYAVIISSQSYSPRGQVGVSITSNSLYGGVIGGWLDHSSVAYSAFMVGYPQTVDLTSMFCKSYGLSGSGEPKIRIFYLNQYGYREPYWSSK